MKYLLLCLLLLGLHTNLEAQRLVKVEALGESDMHIEDISDINLEISFTVRLTNLSHDTLELKWEKIVFSQPDDWVTQVDDNNGIYQPDVKSNYGPIPGMETPLLLLPGESQEVSLHVLPLGAEGEGWYELAFAYADAPGYVLESVDFNARAGGPVSGYTTSKKDIIAYPNPATMYFELTPNSLVDQVDIINVVGVKVRSFKYEHGQRYSISDLPSGLYLISLINKKTGVVKTIRLPTRKIRS